MRKTCFLFSNTCFVFPVLLWNQQGKRESLMIPIRSGLTQMCAEELKDQNKTFCFLFSAYKCVWSNSVVPPEIFLQGSWKILSLEPLKDPYKVIIIYKSSMSKFPPRIPTVLLNQDSVKKDLLNPFLGLSWEDCVQSFPRQPSHSESSGGSAKQPQRTPLQKEQR